MHLFGFKSKGGDVNHLNISCFVTWYLWVRWPHFMKKVSPFIDIRERFIWPGCPSIPLNMQYRGQWNESALCYIHINIFHTAASVMLTRLYFPTIISSVHLNSGCDECSRLKINDRLPRTDMLGLFTANAFKYTVVQRDESFYVCYFLCHMGVTQVNDLHAILPINPCQVLGTLAAYHNLDGSHCGHMR